jgi:sugar phosphate isomerase/epimerase
VSPTSTSRSARSPAGGLRFGYGTNGLADLRLADALDLLADLGYDGVALTLDHMHLDPFAPDLAGRTAAVARQLDRLGLAVVVETGARYLLDPRRKHRPTLLDDDAGPRLELLRRAVRIGADLGAEAVSFWSGQLPSTVDPRLGWDRLVAGCAAVADLAERAGVRLAFEPEPGMLVETISDWAALAERVGGRDRLGLTLDIGHCRCLEPEPEAACVRRGGDGLANVQLDDMRRGVHEHLPFGDGEVDLPAVLAALREIGYRGLASVELPRHSHAGPELAARSLRALRAAEAVLPAVAVTR